VGLPWGPIGVAAAYSVARCLIIVPELAYACQGTPIRLWDVGQAVWRPVATSCAAATSLVILRGQLPVGTESAASLLLDAALFAGSYVLAWFLAPGGGQILTELIQLGSHLLARDQPHSNPSMSG
jgi:PST family polysaccharide transporter